MKYRNISTLMREQSRAYVPISYFLLLNPPLTPRLLLGSPMLIYPCPSQQPAGLQNAVF